MKIVNVTDQYTTIEQPDPFPRLYSISTISRRNASSMMSKWTLSGGPQLGEGRHARGEIWVVRGGGGVIAGDQFAVQLLTTNETTVFENA